MLRSKNKKGIADFALFVVIAIAVVSLILVASWLGKVLGQGRQLVKVKGVVDVYVNLDDKGSEFSFLEAKNGDYDFMEILGVVGSGAKIGGDLKAQMENVEKSIERIKNSDKKNFYISVISPEGKVVYEKKSGNPPLVVGTGGEDILLKWPLDASNYEIISGFGWRKDPFSGKDSFHGGIDIPGNLGDPVYSATDGTVYRTVNNDADLGNFVVIKYTSQRTNTPYYVYYGHMQGFSVRTGDSVKIGEEIGKVGSTGKSQGPHLHFEIRKDKNGDGNLAPDAESVNLCPYLTGASGGIVDSKTCMKKCPVYENPDSCDSDMTVVTNRFDIPVPGGKKGYVELMLW
ncbi:MAG: M23 family metallopeptidase [Candidatus Aenigmarchaeota archaeon]|nr:M23 family metallopeptidase [Candidatus Aenigmarchaeota archaeon]